MRFPLPQAEQLSGDAFTNCDARDRSTLEGVLIEGHADRHGFKSLSPELSTQQNDRLSVERALNVFNEIRKRPGLDMLKNANGLSLLAVSAYGDRRPFANGDTLVDDKANRRIELRFLLSSRTSEELQHLIGEIEPALGEGP